MRVETIGNATLYLGDCREVVQQLGERAKVVCSDPPYRLTSGGKNEGGPSGGWMAEYANDGAPVLCDITWPEIFGVIRAAMLDDADAYVFANDKNVRAMLNAADAVGLRQHNLLTWDKVTVTANRWYMKNIEFVGYFFSGRARVINDPSSKQGVRMPHVDESKHPTEKPVLLCRHYIENSCDVGDLVVDPFMGSGTTGVAALGAGRRFVGAEQDERWFDVAVERVRRTVDTVRFVAPAAVPTMRQTLLL